MDKITLLISIFAFRHVGAQIKACYAWDGSSSGNFPCDPEAEVSACCGPGSICMTSLYCTSQFNTSLVGCCTDRTWKSEACPYRLDLDEVTDPLTQHFSYANNVTICDDGSVCPSPKNETCCEQGQGRTELNYHNEARLPKSVTDLASYYAQAGYTIPGATATPSVNVHAAQSSSVAKSAAHSSTSLGSSATTASSPTSSSARQALSPSASSSGLSVGAKAGIGVGVGVTAMICATVVFVFYLRRRSQEKNEEVGVQEYNGDAYGSNYKDAHPSPAPMYSPTELGTDTAKYEVDASRESQPNSPREVHEIHEVPGSSPIKRL